MPLQASKKYIGIHAGYKTINGAARPVYLSRKDQQTFPEAPYTPKFKVRHSANQTIGPSTTEILHWDTEDVDVYGIFDPGTDDQNVGFPGSSGDIVMLGVRLRIQCSGTPVIGPNDGTGTQFRVTAESDEAQITFQMNESGDMVVKLYKRVESGGGGGGANPTRISVTNLDSTNSLVVVGSESYWEMDGQFV